MRVENTDNALSVYITDSKGVERSLEIAQLFSSIKNVNVKRSNAQVTLILKKKKQLEWPTLRSSKSKKSSRVLGR